MTRHELADAVNRFLQTPVDAKYIGRLERGDVHWPRQGLRVALRRVLSAAEDAELGFYVDRSDRTGTALERTGPDAAFSEELASERGRGLAVRSRREDPSSAVQVLRGETALQSPAAVGSGARQILTLPGGTYFAGTHIETEIFPAAVQRTVLAQVPDDYASAAFLSRPGRGLVVGAAAAPDDAGPALFAIDSRQARRRLSGAGPQARLGIPDAYRIDALTLGMLWAVSNLDDALLDDDRLIAEHSGQLDGYSGLTRSSAGLAAVAGLNRVSTMWLGSDFCARYILRHLGRGGDAPPVFWTREQRGEEASAWLFFGHKLAYLEGLARRYPSAALTRAFCVPERAVVDSQPGERALIFLAIALMESFNIRTQVIGSAEYEGLDGFALDSSHRAIVASWVGCEGVWLVDVTEHRPTIRDFSDAASDAAAHGLTDALSPERRLQRVADYLGLNWAWLVRRCAELSECGLDGLIDPRSRLLSVAGADRACRYVAGLGQAAD